MHFRVLVLALLVLPMVAVFGEAGVPDPDYTLRSAPRLLGLVFPLFPGGAYEWQGVAPAEVKSVTNPTLHAVAGEPVSIAVQWGDLFLFPSVHNIAIWNEDGNVIAGPTEDMGSQGDQETLVWVPPAPGAYAYVCTFHPGVMQGILEVAPG